MKFKILVTNDDGIEAPGIKELVEALHPIADLWVVAPESEQSGKSLSITTIEPIALKQVERFGSIPAWSIRGTPADCTKIGLSILHLKPDLIVSGINKGSNAGRNVLYSGTVGGIVEGVLRGIPGIAFSCCDIKDPEYSRLSPFIPPIVEYILKNPLPSGTLLNVNFPHTKESMPWPIVTEIQGVKLTRQGKGYWIERVIESQTSHSHVKFGAQALIYEEELDSDMHWLKLGYIAAVPIHVDELTDWRYFHGHKDPFEQITSCPLS